MLIDEVLASPGLASASIAAGIDIAGDLRTSYVLRAQNVADYLYMGSAREHWQDSDFPNVAPPFTSIWVEWRTPPYSLSGDRRVLNEHPGARWGAAIRSYLAAENPVPRMMSGLGPVPDGTRWYCVGLLFADGYRGSPMGLAGATSWCVDGEGGIRRFADGRLGYWMPRSNGGERDREYAGFLRVSMFVPWMTMSFLHCRNVRVEKGPPHSMEVQAARRRRGRPPLVRWRTVIVEPFKKARAANTAAGPVGDSEDHRALHICRGHFKRFDGRGLFGKWRGVYWWPMQARGRASAGEVKKDYEVRV